MNTPVMKQRIRVASPCHKDGIAGVFYVLTILAGGVFFFVHGRFGFAVDVFVAAGYLAVAALFYDLFKPVSRGLVWLAAARSRVRQMAEPSPRVHKEVRRTT
jgi:multisubunit Na+/H+ antiporter MnhG subunit